MEVNLEEAEEGGVIAIEAEGKGEDEGEGEGEGEGRVVALALDSKMPLTFRYKICQNQVSVFR